MHAFRSHLRRREERLNELKSVIRLTSVISNDVFACYTQTRFQHCLANAKLFHVLALELEAMNVYVDLSFYVNMCTYLL